MQQISTVASANVSFTGSKCEPIASTNRAVPKPKTADTSEAKKPRIMKRSSPNAN